MILNNGLLHENCYSGFKNPFSLRVAVTSEEQRERRVPPSINLEARDVTIAILGLLGPQMKEKERANFPKVNL